MFNDKKSLILSKIFVILFMVFLGIAVIFAPRLVGHVVRLSAMANSAGAALFLTTLYIGTIPAAALLVSMYLLLHRIGIGEVFVNKNVTYLRFISCCFFAGGLICIVSSLYYAPWLPIGIASVFMGLVVWVVKNVIARAVSLQDDADHTI